MPVSGGGDARPVLRAYQNKQIAKNKLSATAPFCRVY
jgi:hypothetical protein